MAYELRPFRPEDGPLLTDILQSSQLESHGDVDWEAVANQEAFTGLKNGKVIGAAGVWPIWEGRKQAWVMLSMKVKGPELLFATRAILKFLETQTGRIETTVLASYPQGCRWAKALGFQREGILRAFKDNRDYGIYARIT